MTAKELAARLDGMGYALGVSRENVADAKASGLIILHGESDDLAELEGAITDEAGCYGGGVLYITPEGFFRPCDYNEDCRHVKAAQAAAKTVKAVWCGDTGYTWAYETDLPHETFSILDEGERYCRGIVFEAAALHHQCTHTETEKELARAYLEICGEECAGDDSTGVPKCQFFDFPDVDDNGKPFPGGCRLRALEV